jgi:hypothetical protein
MMLRDIADGKLPSAFRGARAARSASSPGKDLMVPVLRFREVAESVTPAPSMIGT